MEVRSYNHTFVCLAYSAYPVPRIVRMYKLKAREPFVQLGLNCHMQRQLSHPQSGRSPELHGDTEESRGNADRYGDNSARAVWETDYD
jgi:hypothetical protein